jgi:hypothetical protein
MMMDNFINISSSGTSGIYMFSYVMLPLDFLGYDSLSKALVYD